VNGLKPDFIGRSGRLALHDLEVIIRNLGLLVLNEFLPNLLGDVAAHFAASP
jgi:hypothetical protein